MPNYIADWYRLPRMFDDLSNNPPTPHRRWFRFGLRTMFVVLTVFSLWLGWQAKIVRDRRGLWHMINDRGGYTPATILVSKD